MRFATGIQLCGPLLQRGKIREAPLTRSRRSPIRQMNGIEHVNVGIEDSIRNEVLKLFVPNLLIVL